MRKADAGGGRAERMDGQDPNGWAGPYRVSRTVGVLGKGRFDWTGLEYHQQPLTLSSALNVPLVRGNYVGLGGR